MWHVRGKKHILRACENMVLRMTLGTYENCIMWTVRVVKSRRTRWAGNVAHMLKKRHSVRVLV